MMPILIAPSGGCELLFNKVKTHDLELPAAVKTMKDLIMWIKDNLLCERPDLFVAGDSVYASVREGMLTSAGGLVFWC